MRSNQEMKRDNRMGGGEGVKVKGWRDEVMEG